MKPLALLALFLLAPAAVRAQPPSDAPEEEVRAAVVALFDAMRASDSSAVRAHFHPKAHLYSVTTTPAGERVVAESPIDRFVAVVGGEHPTFDERIGPIDVRVDGDLATAWMAYAFYLGGEFSHCGVNAFQLARTDDGWKAIHITDTRRTDRCDPSVVEGPGG
ncbi:MAG: nuclear transport factor 2 family protein [Rhodothermales bacterium]|nr:nuclear transport factor 2 family protein [Rhodothermales bacterium]